MIEFCGLKNPGIFGLMGLNVSSWFQYMGLVFFFFLFFPYKHIKGNGNDIILSVKKFFLINKLIRAKTGVGLI